MKRTSGLLIFLLLLGAGWTEISWYIGKRAQHASVLWVEDANQRLRESLPGIPLVIETESYDRGLFSSHARYVLQWRPVTAPGVLLPPSGSYALAWADVDIEHGPYPRRPVTSLDGKPGAFGGSLGTASRIAIHVKGAPALSAALNLPQPIALGAIDARVDYHGDADVQWRMPPWRAVANGSHVSWHGATGAGRVQGDGTLRLSASSDGLTMGASEAAAKDTAVDATEDAKKDATKDAARRAATDAATATTAITGLALTVDLSPGAYVLTPGTVSLDIKRWRDTYQDDHGQAHPWEARDLHWQSKVVSDETGLDLAIDYRLGDLRAGQGKDRQAGKKNDGQGDRAGQSRGQSLGESLGQGSGQVRLSHLDGATLTRVWQDARLLASALILGRVQSTTVSAIVTDLSRAGVALIEHQPRLALQAVTWQSPRGDKATLDTALQMGPAPQRVLNIDPLWAVLDMVRDFDLKARVPAAMLRDFPGLNRLTQGTGIFVKDGADLVAALQTDEDRASINGKAMPTQQWLARYAGPRPHTIPLPQIEQPPGPPLLGLPGDMLQPDLLTPNMLPPGWVPLNGPSPAIPAPPPPSSLVPPPELPPGVSGRDSSVGGDAHAESGDATDYLQDAAADAVGDMPDTTVTTDAMEAPDAAVDAAIDVARPAR
ncbi:MULTISPECIES: DUF945 family protein [unclassified Achromobacter]|uniref:DUF945 family protein n=1 Tax=unclassified Achromobacter TaxID=2626865 RepID=UPI0013038485|nr:MULTISPECIES: DUF945 family protein [unclassified Achromobacter]